MSTISKTKFEKLKLNGFGTSLKINLEPVKTGLELVKTGLFQQNNCLKIWFFKGCFTRPKMAKKISSTKKNPYLVNLVSTQPWWLGGRALV